MKRDLEEYILVLQKQYDSMNKAVEEAKELLLKGELDSNKVEVIQNLANNINTNYQRVLYCRHLVNLPPKFIQKLQNKRSVKELKKYKDNNADKDSVVSETQKNLKEIENNIKGEINE